MVTISTLRACQIGLLALTMAACAGDDDDKRADLTQREKDSILAGSQIPGARAVKKSMSSADSATARQTRLDSAEREP
jgi:hypothetical protein